MTRFSLVVCAVLIGGCPQATEPDLEYRDEAVPVDPAAGFVPRLDVPDDARCSLQLQNCPTGTKCMPWANDGVVTLNDTYCSPLADRPNPIGAACAVEGSIFTGIDDCIRGAICWNVDQMTNTGTCFELWRGDAEHPICVDPSTVPLYTDNGFGTVCVPHCNPLVQDCFDGQGCYPYWDLFACLSDVSGRTGAPADPCDGFADCDPGTACVEAPECDAAACCVPFCDTTAPECPDGTACTPWYADESHAPPALDNVGICTAGG